MGRFVLATIVRNARAATLAGCALLAAGPALAERPADDFTYGASQQLTAFDRAFRDMFGDWRSSDGAALAVPVQAAVYGGSVQPQIGAPAVVHITAGEWQAGQQQEYAIGAHITVSRAADALGAAVDFTRPIGLRRRTAAGAGSAITVSIPYGMPVSARALTSRFGLRQHPVHGGVRMHSGVDLAAPMGSPIVATSDGLVSAAGWHGGYGLAVALNHGGGLQTRFGHMSRIAVVPGQQVRRGQVIGYVGSTGNSTGPHLHYELRVNGQAVNPLSGSR